MIVVDSSIWIAQLRGQTGSDVVTLHRLVEEADDEILVGDLILLEVLQGARDDAHAARIERGLRRFPIVPMMSGDLAVLAARNYRLLRARGVTVRKTIDVVIGTFCLVGGHSLLHDDRDFDPMVDWLGLRVVV